MSTLQPLFELIQHMSPNEKRYFKMQASLQARKGQSDYLKLFEALEARNDLQENYIKKQFGKGKNYSALKSYLYEAILKSLQQYWAAKNHRLEIMHLIEQAEILLQKGLLSQAQRRINKAKKLALRYEELQLLTLIWHIDLFNTTLQLNPDKGRNLKNKLPEFYRNLDNIRMSAQLTELTMELSSLYFEKNFSRNASVKNQIHGLISQLMALDISEDNGIRITLRCYDFLGIAYGMLSQPNQSLIYKQKSLELLEAHPDFLKTHPRGYINKIYNLGIEYVRNRDWEGCEVQISKINHLHAHPLKDSNRLDAYYIFFKSASMLMYLYLMSGGFERAYRKIPLLSARMHTFEDQLTDIHHTNLCYQFAYAAFGAGQYTESLDWLEPVLHQSYSRQEQMIYTGARLMQIIIHYELNNRQLLPALMRSYFRYLSKLDQAVEPELLLLRLMRALLAEPNAPEIPFRQFLPSFIQLRQLPINRSFFEHFDLVAWLESKIQHTAFAEAARARL